MPIQYDRLRTGHAIRVAFGRDASQIAVVFDRTRMGNVRAYKYSAKRKTWKGPLRIDESQLISAVSAEAVKTLPTPCPIAVRSYSE